MHIDSDHQSCAVITPERTFFAPIPDVYPVFARRPRSSSSSVVLVPEPPAPTAFGFERFEHREPGDLLELELLFGFGPSRHQPPANLVSDDE